MNTYRPFSVATGRHVSLPPFKAADQKTADNMAREMAIKEFRLDETDDEYSDASHIIALQTSR